MSLLSDVEGLKKPPVEITVSGADLELNFVPPIGAVINGQYTVTAVTIVLGQGSDPAQVVVTVTA